MLKYCGIKKQFIKIEVDAISEEMNYLYLPSVVDKALASTTLSIRDVNMKTECPDIKKYFGLL